MAMSDLNVKSSKKGKCMKLISSNQRKRILNPNAFLKNMKHVMTDAINEIVKDENQKLQVFQKGGPYLSTKKIGKNNPREAEIKTDNYLRQEWNRNVDRALIA